MTSMLLFARPGASGAHVEGADWLAGTTGYDNDADGAVGIFGHALDGGMAGVFVVSDGAPELESV